MSKRVALKAGQFVEEMDPNIDFDFLSPNQFLGSHTNLIPLQSAVQSGRIFYGARFANQALPVKTPEPPLVQLKSDMDPSGRSFDEVLGEAAGAIHSQDEGTIHAVDKDRITVKTKDGKVDYHLYDQFPFNRKSSYHHIPLVKVGDAVKPGHLLAKSNYTDDHGGLALGINARTGLVAYKGHSMDDAVVISESFAKRLATQQLHGYDMEYRRGVKGGKAHYMGVFPNKFTKAQLDKLDDNGVAKQGVTLEPGDPMILATRPRVVSSTNAQLGLLSKHMKNARSDAAVLWDGHTPGLVGDVANLHSGVKVNVHADVPTGTGSKIVFRSGQKSYHPDTEILTERGWVKIADILQTDRVAALFDDAVSAVNARGCREQKFVARFVKPHDAHSYVYEGLLYGLAAQNAGYLVTPTHRIWRRHTGGDSTPGVWYCKDAKQVHNTHQTFMLAADFDLSDRTEPAFFEIPDARHGVTGQPMNCNRKFDFKTWVQFMAIYLAEGNVRHAKPNDHSIVITQKEKPFCRELERVLAAMGLEWKIHNIQYRTSPNKALRQYLDQFGKAPDKFVPAEIKHAGADTVRLFLDTIWQCDGDKDVGKQFYTSSPLMADDIQHLIQLTGRFASIKRRPARTHQNYDSYTIHIYDHKWSGTHKDRRKAYFNEHYNGRVYCIQVPGEGVILTRFRGHVMWNGNSVVSKIIPDEHMPRTLDGQPLEVLLNHQGIPSRVNPSLVYELLLGKLASKSGKPYKLPAFLPEGQSWNTFVKEELKKNGVTDTEEVFDPILNRKLENPITVGNGYILALHHTAESKTSARGQGSYNADEQPTRGPGEGGQSKRLSGLESAGLMSAGAYNVLREGATLRGAKNDEYWRALRQGYEPKEPGSPFVWDKFKALLQGAGYHSRKLGGGKERLQFLTDNDLAKLKPLSVKTGDIVDLHTMEPVAGGLFDPAITGSKGWAAIDLPHPVVNPAAEDVVRKMLGLTEKQFRSIMAGEMELPEHLRGRKIDKLPKSQQT
jgi:RNA polymerase Rpb2, domain 6